MSRDRISGGKVLFVLAVTLVGASSRADDVVTYGAHVPTQFRDGTPFSSPFDVQWNASDPTTSVGFEAVPGLRNPLGTIQWGHASFGKYVLSGDFGDYGFVIVPTGVEDMLINVFDTEKKTACSIDASGPGVETQQTARTVVVANPAGRKSRIYVGGQGYFGFIEADLDSADPCTWQATQIDGGDPDGLAVLWHEDDPNDPFGRDYVLRPDWWTGMQNIVRVDSTGVSTIATYVLPLFARPGECPASSDRPCHEITSDPSLVGVPSGCWARGWPVQLPQVERGRPKTSARWTSFLEMYFSSGTAGCGGHVAAQEYEVDLTLTNPVIQPVSPVFRASAPGDGADASTYVQTDLHPISLEYDSQRGLWATLWRRKTAFPHFYPTQDGVFRAKASGETCFVNGVAVPVGSGTADIPAGEHCYYNDAGANDIVLVRPDTMLTFHHPEAPFENMPVVQVGNTMYLAATHSVQRANLSASGWSLEPPSSYKVALPHERLPAEPRYCEDGSGPCECPPEIGATDECQDSAHCGGVGVCVPRPETDFVGGGQKVLVLGGAPASLWVPQIFGATTTTPSPWSHNALYWNRVPVTTTLPDGLMGAMRPGLVWSGDRLWLSGRHNGVLQYRVREDGQWSGWGVLPSGAVLPRTAIVSKTNTLEIIASGTNSGVHSLSLTSPLDCAVGACVWSSWTPVGIPGNKASADNPAAVYDDQGRLLVAIRGTDNLLYYGRRPQGDAGVGWTAVQPSIPLSDSPAIAFHPLTKKAWVAFRDVSFGMIWVVRFTPGSSQMSWEIPDPSGQPTHGKGPSLVWDGTRMRLLTTQADGTVVQTAHDGTSWTPWRRAPSQTKADVAPIAAAVHGDVNLIARFGFVTQEAFVPRP